jgi:hypothetical protein
VDRPAGASFLGALPDSAWRAVVRRRAVGTVPVPVGLKWAAPRPPGSGCPDCPVAAAPGGTAASGMGKPPDSRRRPCGVLLVRWLSGCLGLSAHPVRARPGGSASKPPALARLLPIPPRRPPPRARGSRPLLGRLPIPCDTRELILSRRSPDGAGFYRICRSELRLPTLTKSLFQKVGQTVVGWVKPTGTMGIGGFHPPYEKRSSPFRNRLEDRRTEPAATEDRQTGRGNYEGFSSALAFRFSTSNPLNLRKMPNNPYGWDGRRGKSRPWT